MVEKTEFTEDTIKSEVKKHYGMKINDIKVVNGGSANIYKITSDKGDKYILKEFQSKFSGKTILKEINIINYVVDLLSNKSVKEISNLSHKEVGYKKTDRYQKISFEYADNLNILKI